MDQYLQNYNNTMIVLWLLLSWTLPASMQQDYSCVKNLPEFRDQGKRSPSLLVGIQALVPAYQFICSGKIKEWRLSTERRGQHQVDLQVWRPVERTLGAYTLVGYNSFNVQPEAGEKLLVLPVNSGDEIEAQPDDVLGFYLENNANIMDEYAIQYVSNATGITVHFKGADSPLQTIQPYTLTVQRPNTAPILAVEVHVAIPTILPTTPGNTSPILASTTTITNTTITNTPSQPTNNHSDNSSDTLIAAIVVAAIGLMLFVVTVAVFVVITVCIRARRISKRDEYTFEMVAMGATATNPNYTGVDNGQVAAGNGGTEVSVDTKANPAYGQRDFIGVHEYEVPVVYSMEILHPNQTTSLVQTSSGEYDVPTLPRILETSGQHIYEEPV